MVGPPLLIDKLKLSFRKRVHCRVVPSKDWAGNQEKSNRLPYRRHNWWGSIPIFNIVRHPCLWKRLAGGG